MNILLTTLSTLNNRNVNYYYFCDEKGDKKFCAGVSSIEPAAKMLLSTEKIDKIIVIGSNETYKKDDKTSEEDLLKTDQPTDQSTDTSSLSAYGYFKYRMEQFVKGDKGDKEDKELKKIEESVGPEKRRKKIQNITKKYVCGEEEEMFQTLLTNHEKTIKDLRQVIENNIKEDFVKEEDYAHYGIPEDAYDNENESKAPPLIREWIKKIKYKNNSEEIEKLSSSASGGNKSSEIEELKKANQKLIEEINAIKNDRLNVELNYAKSYMFNKINDDERIKCKEGNKNVKIRFIPLRNDKGEENLLEIVNSLRSEKENEANTIFVDAQGGFRTDFYVRNAVLSILENEEGKKIEVKKIIATNFNIPNIASEIVDETEKYRITKLVAGMNAFIKYGKADLVKEFFGEDAKVGTKTLVDAMIKVDEGLSLCTMNTIETGIGELKGAIQAIEDPNQERDYLCDIIIDGIKRDYGEVLEGKKLNIPALVEWAVRKGFIQQAITIIEAKFPKILRDNKVVYYWEKEDKRQKAIELIAEEYNGSQDHERWKFEDIDHYILRYHYGKRVSKEGNYDNCLKNNYSGNIVRQKYINVSTKRNGVDHANNDETKEGLSKLLKEFLAAYNEALEQVPQNISDNKEIAQEIAKDEVIKKAEELKPAEEQNANTAWEEENKNQKQTRAVQQ